MKRKNYSYIWVSLIILIFGILVVPALVERVQNGEIVEGSGIDLKKSNNAPLAYLELNGIRRKVPDFVFLDQDSLPISNEDYLGKVWLAEFFFTTCPSICPKMNRNMKILDDLFHNKPDFGIASITIDPEQDTPTRLKRYSEAYGVKSPHWHFLTGERDSIYKLSNQGFNIFASINPEIEGGFEHQGYFALVDKAGYIRSRRDEQGNPIIYYLGIPDEHGFTRDLEYLKEDIQKLLNE